MIFQTLVTTEILETHLNNSEWVIIDSRFDLMDTEAGVQGYLDAHIPGAVYAHLDRDLSGLKTEKTGRHPLPEISDFIQKLSKWGIDSAKQVVIYDATGGSYASRLWFMLRALGHNKAAVLDGGFSKWVREKRPTRRGFETRQPALVEYRSWDNRFLEADEIEVISQNIDFRLIDARTLERYRGDHEPIDTIAGRIPGAVNRFHGENLNPDGTFLPPDLLQVEFLELLNGVRPENVVVYCGSGVTSCHHILAMEIAGLTGAKLFVGSWSEWIRDINRPRTTG